MVFQKVPAFSKTFSPFKTFRQTGEASTSYAQKEERVRERQGGKGGVRSGTAKPNKFDERAMRSEHIAFC